MRPRILEPADVSGAALAELKAWLGISRSNEDEMLTGLLLTSLAMCEAFTAQAPLLQLVEEQLPARAGRYNLTSRPIESIVSAQSVAQDGSRIALEPQDYSLEFQSPGQGCLTLARDTEGQAVAVQLSVGIAATWEAVPAALKQGLIRLAAYHYRDRDRTAGSKASAQPPASVIALWRPWRTLRLQ